jgi:FAD:protein FMN transferase
MSRTGALRLALLLLILALPLFFWAVAGKDPVMPGGAEPYEVGSVMMERTAAVVRRVDTRSGVMGTLFSLEIAAPDEATAVAACAGAWRTIRRLEDALSTWIPESLLMTVNREAAGGPVAVDPDTFDLLVRSRTLHGMTGGVFDPTIAPLLRLWIPLTRLETAPASADIEQALSLVGFRHVLLDPAKRTVAFDLEGVGLDLSGIAKGYAADLAARRAIFVGAHACRVNAGGDMVALGAPRWSPEGFVVAIRNPVGAPTDSLEGYEFPVVDGAVATSGNYERFTTIGDRRYSHILDPRTGRPVEDAVLQVTVIGTSGTEADAVATALTVLGPVEGMKLAEELPALEALFVLRGPDGLLFKASSGFPERKR